MIISLFSLSACHSLCIFAVTSSVLSCFRIGTVYIYITLKFNNLITLPTEAVVLRAANEKLDPKIRRQRDTTTKLSTPIRIQNINYTRESFS